MKMWVAIKSVFSNASYVLVILSSGCETSIQTIVLGKYRGIIMAITINSQVTELYENGQQWP